MTHRRAKRYNYGSLDAATRGLQEDGLDARKAAEVYKQKSRDKRTLLRQYKGTIERVYGVRLVPRPRPKEPGRERAEVAPPPRRPVSHGAVVLESGQRFERVKVTTRKGNVVSEERVRDTKTGRFLPIRRRAE